MNKKTVGLTRNEGTPAMSIARSVLRISLLALLVGISMIACTHLDRKPDHAASTGKEPPDPFSFPRTDAGAMLKRHMDAAVGHGEDAENIYQASLRELRARAQEVTPLLLNSYRSMPEQQYMARWLVTETLRELTAPVALEALNEIAGEPIPEERWLDDDHRFSQQQEAAIRVTAVEGLGLLAKGGEQRADRYLLEFVRHQNRTVQRTAIRAYLSAGKDYETRRSTIQRMLPKEDHPLITLDTTDPTKVPYPDIPEKFDLREGNGKNAPTIDEQGGYKR